MTRTTRATTAHKVVGSLGVLGAAAAVAGLGTFGSFTDSTTPIATEVGSGTVSINLAQPAAAVPASITGFLPGDSMTRAVTLTNDGTAPLSSISLDVTSSTSTVLTTDARNGLQLSLKSCSVAWTPGGTTQTPTYTCSGTQRTIASGPVVGNFPVTNAAGLNPGGTDRLVFTISLPDTADNAFQGRTSQLNLTFSGIQRTGTAR